jgi:hypothetical protein
MPFFFAASAKGASLRIGEAGIFAPLVEIDGIALNFEVAKMVK